MSRLWTRRKYNKECLIFFSPFLNVLFYFGAGLIFRECPSLYFFCFNFLFYRVSFITQ